MLYLLIGVVLFGYFLERLLDYLNATRWSAELPDDLKGVYNEDEYRKAQQYDKENKRLSLISDTLTTALLVLLLHCGTFGRLDDWALSNCSSDLKATLLFFGVIGIVSELISLPISIYKTFVIEEHFGFNKTTPSTFIKDRIKGYFLAIILIGGIISLFSFFYNATGSHFWIYTWITVGILMIFMSMFYTSLILPLFNKLTVLDDGELRNEIESYCSKTGFGLSDVYVMDGSKRSNKANAFFSGLGGRKKIVLFDTLIHKHPVPELVAILAHETGHYKLKHTTTGLMLSLAQIGFMLYLFSLFMANSEIAGALGGSHHTIELGLFAFGLLYSPISLLAGVILNSVSRKHEFQADAYAAKTSSGNALKEALKKLSVNNLSNLNPHPLYVFFYYSHPPLMQRIKALDRANQIS